MKLCPDCSEEKALSEFYVQRSGRRVGAPTTYCKPCTQVRAKKKYAVVKSDPVLLNRHNRVHREYVEAHRKEIAFSKARSAYGITREQWDALPGQCEICDSTERLVIDHCHDRNVFRGQLCAKCNTGIGMLGDSVVLARAAVRYLEREIP